MRRRILGIETEYGIFGWRDKMVLLDAEALSRRIYRYVRPDGLSSNAFLVNGARLYLDVGSHPEYATAECDDILALVAQDKAGERIMEDLTIRAEKQLHADGIPGNIYLFKNNTDAHGNTYGCHENYLVERSVEMAAMARGLVPFFVTRQLIAGAGKVLLTPEGAKYCLSQRAPHMEQHISSETTRNRTIFNTRDESHADDSEYRRLHVIVGDSNMSETTTLLKVGSTELVLRLIEAQLPLPSFDLASPVRTIAAVNRDVTGRAEVTLRYGRSPTALEVQQAYLQAVGDAVEARGWARTEPWIPMVLELWGRTLSAIERHDHSLIDRDIDWAMKLAMINRYADRHGLTYDAPRVAQMDLAYHDVRRTRGLYYRLEERGMANRVVSTRDVLRATHLPPQTTRAKLRGDFIRAAHRQRHIYTGNWTDLKVRDGNLPTAVCLNPWATRSDTVQDLCRRL